MISSEKNAVYRGGLLLTASAHSGMTALRTETDILLALLPCAVWSVCVFGWRSAFLVLLCAGICTAVSLLLRLILREKLTASVLQAAVCGVLLAFLLPVGASVGSVCLAAAFCGVLHAVLSRRSFVYVQPAAVGFLLFRLFRPDLSRYSLPFVRWNTLAAPVFSAEEIAEIMPTETLYAGNLPDIPMFDLLLGRCAGGIGEVSVLLLVCGGVYLLIRRVYAPTVPAAYLAASCLLFFVFPVTLDRFASLGYETFSGAFLLTAFFLLPDGRVAPHTRRGQLVYGVLAGGLTVLFRYYVPGVDGALLCAAVMGLCGRGIDLLVGPAVFGTGEKKKMLKTTDKGDTK